MRLPFLGIRGCTDATKNVVVSSSSSAAVATAGGLHMQIQEADEAFTAQDILRLAASFNSLTDDVRTPPSPTVISRDPFGSVYHHQTEEEEVETCSIVSSKSILLGDNDASVTNHQDVPATPKIFQNRSVLLEHFVDTFCVGLENKLFRQPAENDPYHPEVLQEDPYHKAVRMSTYSSNPNQHMDEAELYALRDRSLLSIAWGATDTNNDDDETEGDNNDDDDDKSTSSDRSQHNLKTYTYHYNPKHEGFDILHEDSNVPKKGATAPEATKNETNNREEIVVDIEDPAHPEIATTPEAKKNDENDDETNVENGIVTAVQAIGDEIEIDITDHQFVNNVGADIKDMVTDIRSLIIVESQEDDIDEESTMDSDIDSDDISTDDGLLLASNKIDDDDDDDDDASSGSSSTTTRTTARQEYETVLGPQPPSTITLNSSLGSAMEEQPKSNSLLPHRTRSDSTGTASCTTTTSSSIHSEIESSSSASLSISSSASLLVVAAILKSVEETRRKFKKVMLKSVKLIVPTRTRQQDQDPPDEAIDDILQLSSSSEAKSSDFLLALVSSAAAESSQQVKHQQKTAFTILEDCGVQPKVLDAGDPSHTKVLAELFELSGRSEYPQFFLVQGDQTSFFADYMELVTMNDAGTLEDWLTVLPPNQVRTASIGTRSTGTDIIETTHTEDGYNDDEDVDGIHSVLESVELENKTLVLPTVSFSSTRIILPFLYSSPLPQRMWKMQTTRMLHTIRPSLFVVSPSKVRKNMSKITHLVGEQIIRTTKRNTKQMVSLSSSSSSSTHDETTTNGNGDAIHKNKNTNRFTHRMKKRVFARTRPVGDNPKTMVAERINLDICENQKHHDSDAIDDGTVRNDGFEVQVLPGQYSDLHQGRRRFQRRPNRWF